MEDKPFDIRSLPNCNDLFELGEEIGFGATAKVYEAVEKRSGRNLAVKIIKITPENEDFAKEECRILTFLPKHENIVDLYDIYLMKENGTEELWIAMELCIGTALDFLRLMDKREKRLDNSHISFILKGIIQGIIHLHQNRIIHRDIKATNVLITRDGDIRVADFGLSKILEPKSDKIRGRIGSPPWMAPEMVMPGGIYDNKVDVWAMGMTAIELAEGKTPFQDMHPGRAIFQIMKNPPPGQYQSAQRSPILNDFINECLEKNPSNRPVIHEFLQHPLFQSNPPENVKLDIISVMNEKEKSSNIIRPETLIRENLIKVGAMKEEKLLNEDLAMLDDATEEAILDELEGRLQKKHFYNFIGDVLLLLNPYQETEMNGPEYHEKYRLKARSDNAPHIYAIADSAYQDVLHHEETQQILLTGETMSGKTTNMLHLIDHLLFLGQGNQCGQNVKKSINIIHALGNAGTNSNPNSTRHILQTQVAFTPTGKTSGAIFWIYQLEKNRVTYIDRNARNFHIFYYFFHALESKQKLTKYFLQNDKNYKFLRSGPDDEKKGKTPGEYALEFEKFEDNLKDLGFDEGQMITIRRVLSAILILGEIDFESDEDGNAILTTQHYSDSVAELLGLDEKKFSWALVKYCVIQRGEAVMRNHTADEALQAKNVLARGLYFRLVDWIINSINEKLSIPRAILGDKYTVNILDLFGFECSSINTIDQLLINSMNEQLQFFYNQKMFVWEMKNAEEEGVGVPDLNFIDNKIVMDQLLQKPDGLMYLIDEATKNEGIEAFTENLRSLNKSHLFLVNENQFSIAHYTGKITYTASETLNRNREFLPPEMIETMRKSSSDNVRKLFTGLLTTTGNLTMHPDPDKMENREGRWSTGFRSTNKKFKGRKFNTSSKGQYSQSRQMRTGATTFRATCLEILKTLTSNESNTHFVKCIRSNPSNFPYQFHRAFIRQQIRASQILETLQAKQKGYSYRVTFTDFIKRYKFLAFDFNETVEETKDNCRLLLIRLKMEGWAMGKTKVFLKYSDKEYLSRLYEINVRKIVKVQSMMRAFLTRRNLQTKIRKFQENIDRPQREEEYLQPSPSIDKECPIDKKEDTTIPREFSDLESETLTFIKPWFNKWKKQSMYQILLLYRSKQQKDFVYFSQQVHLYNQNNRSILESSNKEIEPEQLDLNADPNIIFPKIKISINKINFKLQDITYFDNTHLLPPLSNDSSPNAFRTEELTEEEWDAPLKPFFSEQATKLTNLIMCDKEIQTDFLTSNLKTSETVENNSSSCKTYENVRWNVEKEKEECFSLNRTEHKNEENSKIADDINKVCISKKQIVNKEETISPSKVEYKGINLNTRPTLRNGRNDTKPRIEANFSSFKTPITELEEKFQLKRTKSRSFNDDDPPYNFRKILRKTNYSNYSYEKKTDSISNTFDFTLRKYNKKIEGHVKERQMTCVNIAPNLVVEGEITDL